MNFFGFIPVLLLSLRAVANSPVCFESKQDLTIPTTKYTMTNRGEIRNGNQKFANLPLPKGFVGECVTALMFKSDTFVMMTLDALDYDETDSFIFRISNKDVKVLWSQHLKKRAEARPPFINEKILLVPAIGEVIAINQDTGNIRWRFSNKDTEGVTFSRIYVQNNSVFAEALPLKFEINLFDGKLAPSKKPEVKQ